MTIEKRIAGSFNHEQEVLFAIEKLKHDGYPETDMMVVAANRTDIPLVASRTGVMVEADMGVNTLAGVMMDSIFTMMTAGMVGTQTSSLSGRLIERGLPEYTAKQCEEEINRGKIILLVDTNGIHDNSTYHEHSVTEIPRAVRLREEQLDIVKERVKVGELQLHKEIVEEQRTVQVPLIREEVFVERRPVTDEKYDSSPFTEDEIIRIPIIEERIEVTKRPVVVEEVIVGKRKIQETKQIQDTIKKEEARIERSGPPSLDVGTPVSELAAAGLEEAMTEIPDIMTVEGNPDMETIKAELKKEENHGKRMGSNDVPGEKNKQSSPSETRTDSPSIKKNEGKNNGPNLAATMQEEAANNNGSNSVATMQKEATKKNENKSQVRKGKNSNN